MFICSAQEENRTIYNSSCLNYQQCMRENHQSKEKKKSKYTLEH